MKTRIINYLATLLCIFITGSGIYFYLPALWQDLWSLQLGDQHDAIKNIFTFRYHIEYGESYWWFQGSHYPFGEQIVFTDNMPTVALFLKWWHRNIFDLSAYSFGILKILFISSMLWAAWFIYRILSLLGVNPIWAALVGAGVALMNPQIVRMGGHFGMGFAFVLPALMYLLLYSEKRLSWLNSFSICGLLLLAGGLHLYFLAMGLFVVTFFWLTLSLLTLLQKKLPDAKFILHYLIQAPLAFLILKAIFYFTDPIIDRPPAPGGMMEFRAHWESVFLPIKMPLGFAIHNLITPIRPTHWESWSYVGLTTVLVSISVCVVGIVRLFYYRNFQFLVNFTGNRYLNGLLGAGIICLLFACAFPFNFGLEDWTLKLGVLRQFRSIGRFTWVFYYAANIIALYLVYKTALRSKLLLLRGSLLLLPLIVFYYEVGAQFSSKVKFETYIFSKLNIEKDDIKKIIIPNKYQAILPLPFYMNGSEFLMFEPQGNIQMLASILSLKTGLPTMAYSLSRTSMQQTWHQFRIGQTLTLDTTNLSKAYPNQKPFLVLHNHLPLNNYQQKLLQASKLIYQDTTFSLYELDFNTVTQSIKQVETKHAFSDSTKQVSAHVQTPLLQLSYNHLFSPNVFYGKGAKVLRPNTFEMLLETTLPDTSEYVLSFWVWMGERAAPNAQLIHESFDNKNKTKPAVVGYNNQSFANLIVATYGDWALVEYPFAHKYKDSKHLFTINLERKPPISIYIDELILRPAEHNVIKTIDSEIWYNNRRYTRVNLPGDPQQ